MKPTSLIPILLFCFSVAAMAPHDFKTDQLANYQQEQEMKNSYRISNDEFNMLRQLFRFNGIPRYVVIDQKGDVINDNFQMHNFEFELKRIIPSYKN
jgi:hypothetical protein